MWYATDKVRWPGLVESPLASGSAADSRVGGLTRRMFGRPLLSIPLTGAAIDGDSARSEGQVGFVWSEFWYGTSDPSYSQAQAHIQTYPNGASGFGAVDGTTLVGGGFPATTTEPDNHLIGVGELDVATLDDYSSGTPLNLMGTAVLDLGVSYSAWAESYATSTDVYVRSHLKAGAAVDSSAWVSQTRVTGEPMFLAFEIIAENVASRLSVSLATGGAGGGLWG